MPHKNIRKWMLFILFLFPVHLALAVDKIKAVGLFKDKAILTIDGKQRLIKKGESSPEGVFLISANSKEAVISINEEQQILKLGDDISSEFKQTTAKKIITIAPTENGMYFINGSINDFQVNFLVDTGATNISINRNEARRLGLNFKLEGEKSQSYTASGVADIYIMNLKKVKVGDIIVRDVRAAIHDSDHPGVIYLGNSFLSKVNMEREGRILKLIK